jgi:hypothetical protein
VPSKEPSEFLNFCNYLSLDEAVNFVFSVWLQFQIIFNNSLKQSSCNIELFYHLTQRPVSAIVSETHPHLLNYQFFLWALLDQSLNVLKVLPMNRGFTLRCFSIQNNKKKKIMQLEKQNTSFAALQKKN